jgi:hypothetical protein
MSLKCLRRTNDGDFFVESGRAPFAHPDFLTDVVRLLPGFPSAVSYAAIRRKRITDEKGFRVGKEILNIQREPFGTATNFLDTSLCDCYDDK